MADKKTIGVIYGGKSSEHEVSILSAKNVISALDKELYDVVEIFISKNGEWSIGGKEFSPWDIKKVCDFALPILHGPNGEDGTVQGLLELLNIPYGGCGVLGCATAMDKVVAKEIFANAGLKQAPYVVILAHQLNNNETRSRLLEQCKALKLPIFVKPANMGSSVGITKVESYEDLPDALDFAAKFDSRILAEQGINLRELETAVMGNDEVITGSIGEILPTAAFYSYDAKYNDESSKLEIPAKLTKEQEESLKAQAIKAYKALGCFGFARVDFMLDKDNGDILINEINAIPGFTKISMFPMLMMDSGMTYAEIINRIIELGYERHTLKNNWQNH